LRPWVDRLNALPQLNGQTFTAADTLKNLAVRTRAPGATEWELAVIGVPGNRNVDLKRLAAQLEPTEVELAGPEDFERHPGLVPGYIGPQLLASLNIRYLVDPLIAHGSAWVTGANQSGRHAVGVVRGRDFVPDDEIGAVEIIDGDLCFRCGAPLRVARGIELGHVFQLGRKYAEVFGLEVLGPDGKPKVITMGSYGIGISRSVAALAEQTLDDLGLCWRGRSPPQTSTWWRLVRERGPSRPENHWPSTCRLAGLGSSTTTDVACRRESSSEMLS